MPLLNDIVNYCDTRVRRAEIRDFPGAENGLQFANQGKVSKVGAAVDAGTVPFRKAIEAGVDFLIVHHGLFWEKHIPVTESVYEKYRLLIENNLAVYGSHLPLDAHPEIGNNAILAQKLELTIEHFFLEHEGTPIAALARAPESRAILAERLKGLFPNSFTAIEYGSSTPQRVAILTGSGRSALPYLKAQGTDTLITGELRQQHFNLAQEHGFNLYACGHYATETFGVDALAREVAERFNLEYVFIPTECPL